MIKSRTWAKGSIACFSAARYEVVTISISAAARLTGEDEAGDLGPAQRRPGDGADPTRTLYMLHVNALKARRESRRALPYGSISMSSTRSFRFAKEVTAKFTAVVVLPTPPFDLSVQLPSPATAPPYPSSVLYEEDSLSRQLQPAIAYCPKSIEG